MRLAGIDCGTNSVRLLIVEVLDGALVELVRELRIVRLGHGVDQTGRLAPEALERTRLALAEYGDLIARHAVDRVRMVATSATRDARNRSEFVLMVRATLGVEPEVISGTQEADLSFAGAMSGLAAPAPPVLVVDIGGGSSEIVLGLADRPISYSLNIGAVRMTERHFRDAPPNPDQVDAVRGQVRAALADQPVPLSSAATAVFVAGTATTIAALALGLDAYDSALIHGARLSRAEVDTVVAMLVGADRASLTARPVIHPGRVDVIAAGAIILREVLHATRLDSILVSERDILDGIVLSLRP